MATHQSATGGGGELMDAEWDMDVVFQSSAAGGGRNGSPTYTRDNWDRTVARMFNSFQESFVPGQGIQKNLKKQLACPFAVFHNEYYICNKGGSCTEAGFPTMARLNQHIDREHLYVKQSGQKFDRPRMTEERSEVWKQMHKKANEQGKAFQSKQKGMKDENKAKWWALCRDIFGWETNPADQLDPDDNRHLVLPGPKLEQIEPFVRYMFESCDKDIVNLMASLSSWPNRPPGGVNLDALLESSGAAASSSMPYHAGLHATAGSYEPSSSHDDDSSYATLEQDPAHSMVASPDVVMGDHHHHSHHPHHHHHGMHGGVDALVMMRNGHTDSYQTGMSEPFIDMDDTPAVHHVETHRPHQMRNLRSRY